MYAQPPKHNCQLWVGTSGYSYAEWTDAGFYPSGTKSGQMLPLYAQHFSVTELNYTWYQMPKVHAVERMRQLAPPNFRFAAKLTRTLTHEVNFDQWRGQAAQYRDGIAPLLQSRQLVAILLQFPPTFVRVPKNRHYLARLLDELDGLPLAVEFRHASWATDRVFAELQRRHTTLVAVDEPDLPGLFPKLDIVTNPDHFTSAFMAAMRAAGVGATCKNNSITTTATMSCISGPTRELQKWSTMPPAASFFSTTTFAPRHLEMPCGSLTC